MVRLPVEPDPDDGEGVGPDVAEAVRDDLADVGSIEAGEGREDDLHRDQREADGVDGIAEQDDALEALGPAVVEALRPGTDGGAILRGWLVSARVV